MKARERRRGPFRVGDHVVSHSGSVHGRIISDDGADILVREHGAHGGIVVGKRRYWHHDARGGSDLHSAETLARRGCREHRSIDRSGHTQRRGATRGASFTGEVMRAKENEMKATDVVVVVDRRGEVMGPFTRQQADEYAELWDRDCPDEAPHVVKMREEVRRRKRGRRQS